MLHLCRNVSGFRILPELSPLRDCLSDTHSTGPVIPYQTRTWTLGFHLLMSACLKVVICDRKFKWCHYGNVLQCNGFCKQPLCEGVPNGFALGTALHHSQFCISKEDVRFRMKRYLGRRANSVGSLSQESYQLQEVLKSDILVNFEMCVCSSKKFIHFHCNENILGPHKDNWLPPAVSLPCL